MSKRILVIDGHPDPDPARLCHALAAAYAEGARESGHEARICALHAWQGEFLRTADAFNIAPDDPFIAQARADMSWADHLVFVFPLWLGSAPALVRAFLEQMGRGGFAVDMTGAGAPGKLRGKSARLIVTMGMPAAVYRFVFAARGVGSIAHSVLGFSGVRPVRTTLLGMIGQPDQARRLAAVRALGRSAA